MVNNLQGAFEKSTKRYFEQNSSDEDINLEYPDSKTHVFREKHTPKPIMPKARLTEKVKEKKEREKKKLEEKINKSKGKQDETGGEESATSHKRKKKDRDKHKKKKIKLEEQLNNDERKRSLSQVDRYSSSSESETEIHDSEKPVQSTKENKCSKDLQIVEAKCINKKGKSRKLGAPSKNDNNTMQKGKKMKTSIEDSSDKLTTKNKSVSKSKLQKKSVKNELKEVKEDEIVKSNNDNLLKVTEKGKKRNVVNNKKQKQVKTIKKSEPKVEKQKNVKKSKSAKKLESDLNAYETDNSLSTHSNTPVFTVDLHKKYSQGAIKSPNDFGTNSSNQNASVKSLFNESISRSSSKSRSASVSSSEESDDNISKDIFSSSELKDKFDLIKERRRNQEDKWNQVFKDTDKMKMKTIKKNDTSDKNKKLKETIQKLKEKSKHNKGRSVIDVILDGAPTRKGKFSKIENKKIKAKNIVSTDIVGKDEYDFVDDTPVSKSVATKNDNPKKKESKKKTQQTTTNSVPLGSSGKKNSKTNMDALELETEQTLKDINKWLECTPKFSEFNSASNSPSRYTLLDDFDAVTAKLDSSDFRRPVAIQPSTNKTENQSNKDKAVTPSSTNTISTGKQTIPLGNHPPAPSVLKKEAKEQKKKSLKEKLPNLPKRKEIHRNIDRLQPGKTKGNLINVHNLNKPDELIPLGASLKPKETKNSLFPDSLNDEAPKLSLGTVLMTDDFGLGQKHNFSNDSTKEESIPPEDKKVLSLDFEKPTVEPSDAVIPMVDEKPKPEEAKTSTDSPKKANLSAWFKAFGAPPKKVKKLDEEDVKKNSENERDSPDRCTDNRVSIISNSPKYDSSYNQPSSKRTRKASTGSTVSEQSSFSQDPDSPRIDDRIGSYPAPYPSPIGASPIMTSPKEEPQKSSSPYPPLNGTIKVGFYQDTTTKNSPEKSCSPREQPSPYSNYSQHIYSSGALPNTTPYNNCAYKGNETQQHQQNATLGFNKNSSLYDQYKQPRSHESDYTSMSPNPSAASPYQQPNSPYQQQEHSPYHQQHSPYSAQPNPPQQVATATQDRQFQTNATSYQNQTPTLQGNYNNPNSPTNYQHPSDSNFISQNQKDLPLQNQLIPNSPYSHSNHSSPYSQHDPNSPYNQLNQPNSPYNVIPTSPKGNTNQPIQVVPSQQQPDGYNVKPEQPLYSGVVYPPMMEQSSHGHDIIEKKQAEVKSHPEQMKASTEHSVDYKTQSILPPQNMFDYGFSKSLPYPKGYDIPPSKAFEMYNRAAQMGYPKGYPANVTSTKEQTKSSGFVEINYDKPTDLVNMGYQAPESGHPVVKEASKPINMVQNSYEHPVIDHSKSVNYPLVLNNYPTNLTTLTKSGTDANQHAKSQDIGLHQRYDIPQSSDNIDLSNYKGLQFGGQAGGHPPITTSYLNLPVQNPNPYYDNKNISNMYNKGINSAPMPPISSGHMPTMFTNPSLAGMPYNPNTTSYPSRLPQQNMTPMHDLNSMNMAPNPISVATQSITEPKSSKRGKKRKNANNQSEPAPNIVQQNMSPQAQVNQPTQLSAPPTQGFQSYSGYKGTTSASNTAPISLKPPGNLVPGSAFNFGQAPGGLGLTPGLYGDNSGYLDEYRNSNPYYLPPQNHRPPQESGTDKSGNPTAMPPNSTAYHQFLSSRPSYPFMNQLDTNTYQQCLQRHHTMMLNQGLLPPSAPGAYSQPCYHPALSIHKPYDSMNNMQRPPWY